MVYRRCEAGVFACPLAFQQSFRSIGVLACVMCGALALASQTATTLKNVTKVYVDSFGGKRGAADLREQVTAELTRSHRFRVVSKPAEADAVLRGTGEVWVKGHYSLNPRIRFGGEATAVYAGYLSVELQGVKKEILWSYLAAPHSATTDVERDLAKLVVRKLTDAVEAEAQN